MAPWALLPSFARPFVSDANGAEPSPAATASDPPKGRVKTNGVEASKGKAEMATEANAFQWRGQDDFILPLAGGSDAVAAGEGKSGEPVNGYGLRLPPPKKRNGSFCSIGYRPSTAQPTVCRPEQRPGPLGSTSRPTSLQGYDRLGRRVSARHCIRTEMRQPVIPNHEETFQLRKPSRRKNMASSRLTQRLFGNAPTRWTSISTRSRGSREPCRTR